MTRTNWRFCKSGNLVHRFGSYELSIDRRTRKACFTVVTNSEREKKSRRNYRDDDDDDDDDHRWNRSGKTTTTVCSDREIPLNTWVHIAGVYDGNELKIVVNCQEQLDVKNVSGSIRKLKLTPLFLGGQGLFAKLEETRISNIARHEFNCDPDSGGTETTFTHILRKFLYSGWRVIEEHEQRAEVDQPLGQEVVSRQFVDGLGIDEHLQIAVYDATGTTIAEERYLHENHRGDIVGVTDIGGNVVYRFEYSTYGEIFEVNSTNELDEFTDFEEIVYGFQGRRVDSETDGLMYFRNRYYNPKLGRFIQRDPKGYIDSYGLYEAFRGNPFNYIDPLGLDSEKMVERQKMVDDVVSFIKDVFKGTEKQEVTEREINNYLQNHEVIYVGEKAPSGSQGETPGYTFSKETSFVRKNIELLKQYDNVFIRHSHFEKSLKTRVDYFIRPSSWNRFFARSHTTWLLEILRDSSAIGTFEEFEKYVDVDEYRFKFSQVDKFRVNFEKSDFWQYLMTTLECRGHILKRFDQNERIRALAIATTILHEIAHQTAKSNPNLSSHDLRTFWYAKYRQYFKEFFQTLIDCPCPKGSHGK